MRYRYLPVTRQITIQVTIITTTSPRIRPTSENKFAKLMTRIAKKAVSSGIITELSL